MNKNQETTEFSQLVLGFSSAALYALGKVEVEDRKIHKVNLPLAKHNIDILEMIKVKTKGNLSTDEEKLILQVIQDLKISFVDATK
jgi:hypothetical protein